MKTLRTTAPTLALAILTTAVAPAIAAPIASAKSFDGQWSVLIVTQKGTCDRAYRYPVKIDKGAVGYAGRASFTVSGKVGEKGTVIVTVARGSQSARNRARLTATHVGAPWAAGWCD